MRFIKRFFCIIAVLLFSQQVSFASLSSECTKYSDCDTLAACELVLQVERAISGLGADYNNAIAQVIKEKKECAKYADEFKKNIDVLINENPEIRLAIDWDKVRNPDKKDDTKADDEVSDEKLIETIVNVLGPDTEEQKTFFVALATAYVNAFNKDESTRLNDAFVLDFLGSDTNVTEKVMNKDTNVKKTNLDLYRSAVRTLTGSVTEAELGIDINWDDVLTEISNVLDKALAKGAIIICENNRSYQAGIDVAGWVVTAVAAIATFYAGGAGGAAVAAGKAAIGAGLKAAAKGIAKVGGKAAAKSVAKAGSKQLAQAAVKLGLKQNMRGWAKYAGKGVLKTGVKNFTKIAGQNLSKKWTKIAATGASLWAIGKAASNSAGSTLYSLLSSDLDKEYLNCKDLDRNEGCYAVCGDAVADAYINKRVLYPMFRKNYCVNPTDYMLYEVKSDGHLGEVLQFDLSKQEDLLNKVKSSIQDKNEPSHNGGFTGGVQRLLNAVGVEWGTWGCDGNEDDIDMYIGRYVYDPDTLDLAKDKVIIEAAIRLDD